MIVTTLLGYFILLVFFYLERRLRHSDIAAQLKPGQFDRHSTRLLGQAYGVSLLALLAAWILNGFEIGRLPDWVGWLGALVALFGLFMRVWANRVLGSYYTRRLQVAEGQAIVHTGPYRVIRHPGYLGMILLWVGAAAATGNWIVSAVVVACIGAAYYHRIESEEQMLTSALPGYAEYRAKTWRLIPPIY